MGLKEKELRALLGPAVGRGGGQEPRRRGDVWWACGKEEGGRRQELGPA